MIGRIFALVREYDVVDHKCIDILIDDIIEFPFQKPNNFDTRLVKYGLDCSSIEHEFHELRFDWRRHDTICDFMTHRFGMLRMSNMWFKSIVWFEELSVVAFSTICGHHIADDSFICISDKQVKEWLYNNGQ